MKREADTLRSNVRELVDELEEERKTAMPANEFLVSMHRGRVTSLRLFMRAPGEEIAKPINISVQQACELAAWLVVGAGLGDDMDATEARDYFLRALEEALSS